MAPSDVGATCGRCLRHYYPNKKKTQVMSPSFIISIVGLRKPNWFHVDRGAAADGFVHRMDVMSSHLPMLERHVDVVDYH